MREARLILPSDNNFHIDDLLEAKLIVAFGGFTMTVGYGGWNSGNGDVISEGVSVYDVAMNDTQGNADALSTIVLWLFAVTDERTIYTRYPNGTVVIQERPLDTPAAVAT